MPGVDDGVAGQRAESAGDGIQDGREVGVRPPGRAWAALEQGVATEHRFKVGRIPADRPGECPGVCRARSSMPATRSVSPSSTVRKSLSGCVIRHSTSSAGCISTGASSASPNSGATVTWSLWPCVQTTATTWRPPTDITIGPASWAASKTTTSESSPTIHMLLSTSQLPPSSSKVPWVTTRWIALITTSPPSATPRRRASCGTPLRWRPTRCVRRRTSPAAAGPAGRG